jgi:hypothetical protein
LREEQEEDDKAERVKALEEMMKLQQIDEQTFVKLRDEILGGDVASTHLVKGLDWKLLERVKRGEDVLSGEQKTEDKEPEEDVDDAFDELENVEVQAVKKEAREKKGEMAPPSLVPGRKRTRDQILAEMKAARKAAQEAKGPSLGAKFKKVGEKRSQSRIETDIKGREVLITVDENGNEKRKVRKVQIIVEGEKDLGLLVPDPKAKPLGMEVPEIPKIQEEEDEDIDIFDDAGDDYDPLAGLDEEDDDDDEDSAKGEVSEDVKEKKGKAPEDAIPETGSMAPPPRPKPASGPRNYFGDAKPEPVSDSRPKALSDPTLLAALKKASTIAPLSSEPANAEEAARAARHKKMLQQDDRDAQDMDMGFGSSRFGDEEDFEDKKIKLSEWGGKDDGGDDEEGGKGEKGKRKRGPKKRKGDANSAADVLKAIERRKASSS